MMSCRYIVLVMVNIEDQDGQLVPYINSHKATLVVWNVKCRTCTLDDFIILEIEERRLGPEENGDSRWLELFGPKILSNRLLHH